MIHYKAITSKHALIFQTDCFEVILKQLPAFLRLDQAPFAQNKLYMQMNYWRAKLFSLSKSQQRKDYRRFIAEKFWTFMRMRAETNLVQKCQFRFENQSQARKVRWQIPQNIDGSHISKIIRGSRYYCKSHGRCIFTPLFSRQTSITQKGLPDKISFLPTNNGMVGLFPKASGKACKHALSEKQRGNDLLLFRAQFKWYSNV